MTDWLEVLHENKGAQRIKISIQNV